MQCFRYGVCLYSLNIVLKCIFHPPPLEISHFFPLIHNISNFSVSPSSLPLASPDVPTSFTVSPGPAAFHINLQKSVLDGGSPITQYMIQWRNESESNWQKAVIPFSGNFLNLDVKASSVNNTRQLLLNIFRGKSYIIFTQ